MQSIKLNLQRSFFSETEKVILESGTLSASAFLFKSGVCGLRIKNSKGEMVILPYQGQQIWSASFCDKELVMKSTFSEPVATTDYLSTYGGFMLHCGATAMGVPGEKDKHPLHGELPNMQYEEAYVEIGEDDNGRYIKVGGKANYSVGFTTNYTANPQIKLYETETVADVSMTIQNLRCKPMEYMYMCHVNFRPVDGSGLVYSAPADSQHIKVHKNIPSNMPVSKANALKEYMEKIEENPGIQNVIDPTCQVYDPEIVFTIKYNEDKNGYAHCMQIMPGGDAFYVGFKPSQLPYGIRWIARTGDEDALGMVLPATAEHKGYTYSKENGDIRIIDAGESVELNVKVGYLSNEQAVIMNNAINDLI